MVLPNGTQVDAAMRHVYTSAGTVLALASAVALVPQADIQPIMDALREMGDGLHHIFHGAEALMIVIGPLIAGWMGKIAYFNSGFGQRLKSVIVQASQPGNQEQKEQVVVATATLPEVEKIVAPTLADAPSPKVVAQ